LTGQVHPTQDDPVVAALSESVGGPVGQHASDHPWWTPVRVVLALAALCFAAGMLQKGSCFEDAWQDDQARYSHMCESRLPHLYVDRGLAELSWPFTGDEQVRDRYDVMEQPAGAAYAAWGTAVVTRWLSGSPDLSGRYGQPSTLLVEDRSVLDEIRLFMVVNALLLAAAALASAWLISRVNPRRPWDAAIFAASPVLVLTALLGFELLAVACVAGALWALARRRPVLAGVLIGLGASVKLFPVLLLLAVLLLCVRRRSTGDLVATLFPALVTWALMNLPAYVSGPAQWRVFWSDNLDDGAGTGSLWLVIDQAGNLDLSPITVTAWSWAIFALWGVGVAALALTAPRAPRPAQLGFLLVAGFVLVHQAYEPQYALWLLPFAVLARPRWRDQLVWQSGEVLYFAGLWWYLGGFLAPSGGGDAGFYWIAIILRMLAELYLVAVVVRDIWWPEHDPVVLPAQLTMTRSNAVAV